MDLESDETVRELVQLWQRYRHPRVAQALRHCTASPTGGPEGAQRLEAAAKGDPVALPWLLASLSSGAPWRRAQRVPALRVHRDPRIAAKVISWLASTPPLSIPNNAGQVFWRVVAAALPPCLDRSSAKELSQVVKSFKLRNPSCWHIYKPLQSQSPTPPPSRLPSHVEDVLRQVELASRQRLLTS
jgi:hypothetical protein